MQAKSEHEQRVALELQEWSAVKLAKQQRRRERRAQTSPAPVRPEEPKIEPAETGERFSKPTSVFRKMVREGSDKRLKVRRRCIILLFFTKAKKKRNSSLSVRCLKA